MPAASSSGGPLGETHEKLLHLLALLKLGVVKRKVGGLYESSLATRPMGAAALAGAVTAGNSDCKWMG